MHPPKKNTYPFNSAWSQKLMLGWAATGCYRIGPSWSKHFSKETSNPATCVHWPSLKWIRTPLLASRCFKQKKRKGGGPPSLSTSTFPLKPGFTRVHVLAGEPGSHDGARRARDAPVPASECGCRRAAVRLRPEGGAAKRGAAAVCPQVFLFLSTKRRMEKRREQDLAWCVIKKITLRTWFSVRLSYHGGKKGEGTERRMSPQQPYC